MAWYYDCPPVCDDCTPEGDDCPPECDNCPSQSDTYNPYPGWIYSDDFNFGGFVEYHNHTSWIHNQILPYDSIIWEFKNQTENGVTWIKNGDISYFDVDTQGGYLVGQTHGNDPYFYTDTNINLGIDLDEYDFIEIKMQNQTASHQAQIFVQREGDSGWVLGKWISDIIPNDDSWTIYRYDLRSEANWTGILRSLRIDPCEPGGGFIFIDYIKLTKSDRSYQWNFDTNTDADIWHHSQHVQNYNVTNGYAHGILSGEDAYLSTPGDTHLNIDAADFPRIEISYRNNTNGQWAQIFWEVRESDGSTSPYYGKSFYLPQRTDEDTYSTAIFDLSEEPNWRESIKMLRFNPTRWGNGNGSFGINHIRLVQNDTIMWEFQDQTENGVTWEHNGDINYFNVNTQEGYLAGQTQGNDPYFYTDTGINLGIDLSEYDFIEIKMQNQTSSTQAQVFVQREGDSGWVLGKWISDIIPNDSQWTIYRYDMRNETNWTGVLRSLRIDPCEPGGGFFFIDYIKLTKATRSYQWNFDTDTDANRWYPSQHVQNYNVINGYAYGELTGEDAYISTAGNTHLNINATDFSKIEIIYRNNTNGQWAQIIWKVRESDGSNSTLYGKSFYLPHRANEDAYSIAIFDLSDDPNWREKINMLRFNPTRWGNGNGSFEIHGIRLLP